MAKSDAGSPGPRSASATVYAKPTPKVARRPPAKVLTAAEKAAFLASRPDLVSKP
jgi:hypothetical protein